MQIPELLLDSLDGTPGFNRSAFIKAHEFPAAVSIRFNPSKLIGTPFHPLMEVEVPWSSAGYYLKERPVFTFDPLLHAGVYYVQEASSMFLEQALRQTLDLSRDLKVLDLCAAPGGKSTLIQSLLTKNSLLVSNEVIKSRVSILEENCIKWGAANCIITNNDARDFSQLPQYFDALVVDAPCSGSGLFRRDPRSLDEWSEEAVSLCSFRQQRILADAILSLKPDGVLIYSTCSYSPAEDEAISDWIIDQFDLQPVAISIKPEWGVVESFTKMHGAPGYRFFPGMARGEGFFLTVFRKKNEDKAAIKPFPRKNSIVPVSKTSKAIVAAFLNAPDDHFLYGLGERILAFPASLLKEFEILNGRFYIKKAGVALGKIAGKELVPDHELALSGIVNEKLVGISLKKEEALQYLRREEVSISTEVEGWALMLFEKYPLGWVKVLPNRINNYYPKQWRILKGGSN